MTTSIIPKVPENKNHQQQSNSRLPAKRSAPGLFYSPRHIEPRDVFIRCRSRMK